MVNSGTRLFCLVSIRRGPFAQWVSSASPSLLLQKKRYFGFCIELHSFVYFVLKIAVVIYVTQTMKKPRTAGPIGSVRMVSPEEGVVGTASVTPKE